MQQLLTIWRAPRAAVALAAGLLAAAAQAGGPYPVRPPPPPLPAYPPPFVAPWGWPFYDPFAWGPGLAFGPPWPAVPCTAPACLPPPAPHRHRHDAPPPEPAAPARADPVIEPREGQSPARTEADRQDCNRLATRDRAALLDADVFQRSVAACLEGRGYTVR